jgi:beta-xylosidase
MIQLVRSQAGVPVRRFMTVTAILAALLLTGTLASAQVPTHAAVKYSNPVFTQDFPDPMVLRLNAHDYYAYATTAYWTNGYFPILHSTDAVHWKHVGDAFKNFPQWSTGDFWAPDIVKRGKSYYFYYVGKNTLNYHCIAVATGTRPTGPFKTRNIIDCNDAGGLGFIDPDIFIDTDGKEYLYVASDAPHTINVIPMQSDLIHKAGISKPLFGVSQKWESGGLASTVEGSYTIKHGNLYYIFYSGNSYEGPYAEGYATSTSPTGPFTKFAGNPVLKGNKKVHGPGGGSVFEGPDGRLWMAYHARVGPPFHDIRNFRIDPLVWHGDAVTIPVHPR